MSWFKKIEIDPLKDFKVCEECGGLFKRYKMTQLEVIRRPPKCGRGHWFKPYFDYAYYCIHCKRIL